MNWMEILSPHDKWNEKHILAIFSLFGVPGKLLDVGCGTGAMTHVARRLNSKAYGLDQLHSEYDYLHSVNLEEYVGMANFKAPSTYDMVISLEVGEHLSPEFHDAYCDTVANHVERNGICIFSSAYPGQGGDHHKGEKPAVYWREKLDMRGLSYRRDLTARVALAWNNIDSPLFWLPANVQVFDR